MSAVGLMCKQFHWVDDIDSHNTYSAGHMGSMHHDKCVPVCCIKHMSSIMKNKQWGFRTGSTQNGLYKHRRWLEARNFGSRK